MTFHQGCDNLFVHKNGFRENHSLRLIADAQRKHNEKQKQTRRANFAKKKNSKRVFKKGQKGGKAIQASIAQ